MSRYKLIIPTEGFGSIDCAVVWRRQITYKSRDRFGADGNEVTVFVWRSILFKKCLPADSRLSLPFIWIFSSPLKGVTVVGICEFGAPGNETV